MIIRADVSNLDGLYFLRVADRDRYAILGGPALSAPFGRPNWWQRWLIRRVVPLVARFLRVQIEFQWGDVVALRNQLARVIARRSVA